MNYAQNVEQWNVWEIAIDGYSDKNPFVDYNIKACFFCKDETVSVNGFYDGDGIYKVRFMPNFAQEYTFKISGSFSKKEYSGKFSVIAHSPDNHGPVFARGFHFEYADGKPYYPLGTTAYVWALQDHKIQEETINELSNGWFNKMRFCVFPKHYLYNIHDPISFPYEGTPCSFSGPITGNFYRLMGVQPGNNWNFKRFNPDHFKNIENAVIELSRLGIEADLILMHAYDRWGFSTMTAEEDDLYIRYVIARFAAFRNVWWSLANEYDLLRNKTVSDWERMANIIVTEDPYKHLRSIHNCGPMYDYTRPWITHCSIQRTDLYKCAEYTDEFRTRYQKPVVLDEIAYEGNIDQGWGNIGGQELMRRFWEAAMRGGYATHGETYENDSDILWWSHGGNLHGESHKRIKFLHQILCDTPSHGLCRLPSSWDEVAATAEQMGDSGYYIYYYGFNRPGKRKFYMPEGVRYIVDIIDTWEMTITEQGEYEGDFTINLPGKEYMAVRLRRI